MASIRLVYWSEGQSTARVSKNLADDLGISWESPNEGDSLQVRVGESILFVMPTYDGLAPDCAITTLEKLKTSSASSLSGLSFAVCGTGDNTYCDWFNVAAQEFDKLLESKGAKRLLPVCSADVQHPKGLQFGIDLWGEKLTKLPTVARLLPEKEADLDDNSSTQAAYRDMSPEDYSPEMMEEAVNKVNAAVAQVSTPAATSGGFYIAQTRVMCSHEPLSSFGVAAKGSVRLFTSNESEEPSVPLKPEDFISTNKTLATGIIAVEKQPEVSPLHLGSIEAVPVATGTKLLAADNSMGDMKLIWVTVGKVEAHHFLFEAEPGEANAVVELYSTGGLPLLRPDTHEVVALRLREGGRAAPIGMFLDKLNRRKQLSAALDTDLSALQARLKKRRKPMVKAKITETVPVVEANASMTARVAESPPAIRSQPVAKQQMFLDSIGVLIAVFVLFLATGAFVIHRLQALY